MQPTFLPWAGYINLIASVDLFVFLDDAQYERASWQNRNRILVAGEAAWLTVPVCRDQLGASLDKVWTDDKLQWRRKHLRTLEQAYARTPGRAEMMDIVHGLEGAGPSPLADLNISLLEAICVRLGVATPTMRSSALAIAGRRTERLVSILERVGCTEYVTTPGALDYLGEDGFSAMSGLPLLVHRFIPPTYRQHGAPVFVSHLSIVDVIASLGCGDASDYVRGDARWLEPYVTLRLAR